MRILTCITLILVFLFIDVFPLRAFPSLGYNLDPSVVNWLNHNISPITKLPYSFQIPKSQEEKIYTQMNDAGIINGAIERMITKSGLDIYDGAVYQIVQTMLGGADNIKQAQIPVHYYWQGGFGDLWNVRAGYPINKFVYDAGNPMRVPSDINAQGQRGFIFRIINADGEYLGKDPLTGQERIAGFPNDDRVHWLDWKPVAGENAWVVIAALQLYHKKYFDKQKGVYLHNLESKELELSKELARAAMLLQSDCGGIRMAPLGTYRNLEKGEQAYFTEQNWWFNHISTENNISWYAALRMLYDITGDMQYRQAMQGIEKYMFFVWNHSQGYFYQGAYQVSGQWFKSEEEFALDVQTWAISCFGPEVLDGWLGLGTAYHIWQVAKEHAGVFNAKGEIKGVGYTDEHDRISVEWSAGAMVALDLMFKHYQAMQPQWANQVLLDKQSLRRGMENLRSKISQTESAYSYSSKRGWIPFGWNSHAPEVLSLASTGWMVFVDAGVNPFCLLE